MDEIKHLYTDDPQMVTLTEHYVAKVQLHLDEPWGNPLEDQDGMGSIQSFSYRHINHYKGDPRDAFAFATCLRCGAEVSPSDIDGCYVYTRPLDGKEYVECPFCGQWTVFHLEHLADRL